MNFWHVWQRDFLLMLVRLVAGAYPVWHRTPPAATQKITQKIYFSNHTSHLDTLAILAALPHTLRATVRPIAARDYWNSGKLKRHIAQNLLNVVLIDRHHETGGDPLDPVRDALAHGHSIIIFPEGTRSADALPHPFKSGLFHLASEFPRVELAPVYLENLQRVMPKGAIWPVPLICKVNFGASETLLPGEDKAAFLARMRTAVVSMAAHRPAEQPAEQSAKQPAERSAEQPAVRSGDPPAARPKALPANPSADQPAIRAADQPATQPAAQPANLSTDQPTN